jgi:phosphohistidine swiveling domain-containing protein
MGGRVNSRIGAADRERIGGKAVSLRRLQQLGFRVPAFVTVPVGHTGITPEVRSFLDTSLTYAVRSSSPVEDGAAHSFAGQFTTILGVPGDAGSIGEAVLQVLESASSSRLQGYGRAPATVEMAVVVQHMVPSLYSGVAFSRNPLTGLDEVVIESAQGVGEGVVGGLINPDRWVFRWGCFVSRPPTGDDALAERVARGTRAIASGLGHPVDVEWAWDGTDLWWLQARPITGLENVTIYSRRIAKEVMPGIISPLTWSVNVPVVNRAWIRLIDAAVGPTGLSPDRLARRFGGRAYFDMTALGAVFERAGMPRDSLELLIGLDDGPEKPSMRPTFGAALRNLPRMARLGWSVLRYPRRAERDLDSIRHEATTERPLDELSDLDLACAVERAMERAERAAYANIVVPLLAAAHAGRARKALQSAGIDPDTVDPTAGMPQAGAHDPDRGLGEVRAAVGMLPPELRAGLADTGWEGLISDGRCADLVAAVERYLDRFGALSERTTDLTAVPWREDPIRVVRMAHTPARQRTGLAVASTGVGRRVRRKVESAGRMQILRESVSQAYTGIYMDLRPLLMEAGSRLAFSGRLPTPERVVHLDIAEVLVALRGGDLAIDVVDVRAAEMLEAEGYRAPELIVGDDFVPLPALLGTVEFRGVGSSRGRHRGPVVVVRDPTAHPALEPGTVLAVPHSDVSWTPLFARAAAVVSEAGGMLSHSSIVAREFGIPCVVSAEGVCDLDDGTEVVVDGYTGVVTVVGS